jgi:tyrosyl-DNA phosphodiesterase-1
MINFTQLLNPQCKLGVFKSLKFTKCLFTTFVYGEELIFPIIKSGVPTHVIMHHESRFGKVAKHSDYSNCTFIFPKREMAYGVFHPKLMLLEFDTFLRVVISSANLSEVDWYLLSQVCWFQDFPLLTESETQDNCKFYKDLNEFITHIYNRMDPIIDIRKYNFTNASVSLVYSLNGRFKQFDDYGLGKICKLQAGSKLGKDAKVMFQTSSVGNINDKYLQCFYKCAQGVSPSSKDYPEVEAHFQMQFPTNEYIQNNRYGAESADCIIMPSKYYASKSFPQRILHQLTPIDGDDDYDHNLFHAKVMVISDDKGISDDTCLYIGSHNFSPSAWGKFEKDNSQLCMNNYELGVWFPAKEGSQEKKKQLLSRLMFKYPPLKYKPSDVPFQLDNINDE